MSPDRVEAMVVMNRRVPWGSWPFRAFRHLMRTTGKVPTGSEIVGQVEVWRAALLDFAEAFPEGRSPAQAWVASMFAPSPKGGAKTVLPAEARAMVKLDQAGRQITPEAIRDLAPLVSGEHRHPKIWRRLVRRGALPTEAAMQELLTRRTSPEVPLTPDEERAADGREAEVAGWVARYVEECGQGPLWSEVFQAFGWRRAQGQFLVRKLQRQDWLVSTSKQRSLRPGSRWVQGAEPELPSPRVPPIEARTEA
ncbi:hypothetical protein AB0L06_40515 [Spirillospora sp. NPDC052269]